MKSLDPSVNEVMRLLRQVDPARADLLAATIANRRADTLDAEFALVDLAEGARRMVVDLLHDKSAREHVYAAIADTPIEGRASELRRQVAARYLARGTDYAGFEASGMTPEDFLERRLLQQQRGGEEGHLDGLSILREAMKTARAEEVPDI